jgi:hypothetical protein
LIPGNPGVAAHVSLRADLSAIMTTASTPGLSQDDSLELALPPPFEPIQVIKDMSNERLNQRAMVHVIGIVKDYQPPILTKGTGKRGLILSKIWY